jgi:homoserine dehydrogenase
MHKRRVPMTAVAKSTTDFEQMITSMRERLCYCAHVMSAIPLMSIVRRTSQRPRRPCANRDILNRPSRGALQV